MSLISTPSGNDPLLRIEDLTVSYHRVPAIHHLSLELSKGHCVGLFGPNGAGKSTLLKAVAGLLSPETGQILVEGKPHRAAVAKIAYLPQRESVDWDFPVTVEGLVEMGRYRHTGPFGTFRQRDRDAVREALDLFRLSPLAGRQIRELSGGQQQRAFLARSWAQEADLYLLDEPFTGLDRTSSKSLSEAFARLKEGGKLLLASHHALDEAPALFDTAVLINGELVSAGPVPEALSARHVGCAYGTDVYLGRQSLRTT
jgi:ABC-type Mn2+/Zn2+ transport system ATPase subunit